MSTRLFVGNLDFKVTENDLQDAFAAFGTVTEANLVMDRTTGRPRGFAFVTMSAPEEAQKAIDAMNGMSPPYGQLRKDYERFPAAGLGSAGTEKDLSQVRVTTPPYSVVAFFLSRSTAL